MSFAPDTDIVATIAGGRDPALGRVSVDRLQRSLRELRALDGCGEVDRYLLTAMRLFALAGNGHTRLIPNAAIQVLPLRFVALGADVFLGDGTDAVSDHVDARLVAVNGLTVDELLSRASPFLAGTPARQRAVGAILFAWPEALRELGVPPRDGRVVYAVEHAAGDTRSFAVPVATRVPASKHYPMREHGAPRHPRPPGPWAEAVSVGPNVGCIRLPDFFCEQDAEIEANLERAARNILSEPGQNLVFDVRGNPGGDFLRTLGLVTALVDGWRGERFAILVDKFTFSAAIAFVAILTQRLGRPFRIIGEAMGDDTRFHAEGGIEPLPGSGAVVRYSTAWHDWETGRPDRSTPAEIARHLVPAGRLLPHIAVSLTTADIASGRDPQMEAALYYLSA